MHLSERTIYNSGGGEEACEDAIFSDFSTVCGSFLPPNVSDESNQSGGEKICGVSTSNGNQIGEEIIDECRGVRGIQSVQLLPGMWRIVPETGQACLSDQALTSLINTDPIKKWYILDPEPIARGQFAVVYHCRHRLTGKEFAAKFADRRRLGADATPDILHEIAVNVLLASCQQNVRLQDVFTTESTFVLVMEFAPGGDMQTLLDENLVPYERDVIGFLRQLLEGLVFIHDKSLVHLDIKPQNLVLMGEFPNCAVKLCDFEISRLISPGVEVREILGTPDYVAPEILHYEPITTKTDMWSLGVLTYVLLTGFLPFGGDNDQETFMQISRGELDFPNELFEDITPHAIDFMEKLLMRRPEKRMSARDCLNHPWMKRNINSRPTPPSTLDIPSAIEQPIFPAPVNRTESSPSFMTSTTPVNTKTDNDCETVSVTDVPNSTSDGIKSPTTPVFGRPPLHPRASQKSMSSVDGPMSPVAQISSVVPPLPATKLFSNKESRMGSRQNLSRLRSMSKSREVLSERIQMSNLKKTLSKSRERLHDARLGLSTSKDDLKKFQSLSQSVEALTALSQLHQNGALYKSCNNIFVPVGKPRIKIPTVHDRMYQSMASIDRVPESNIPKKVGYFESRFSVEEDDYNDMITQRNTNMNIVISDDPSGMKQGHEKYKFEGLKKNNNITSDKICSRHNHKQPEPQSTRKVIKISKAEKMKKDAQKRRKERKDREQKENERHRKFSLDQDNRLNKPLIARSSEESTSPTLRRGSVCHVEQRLQERHERQIEKQERELRKLEIANNRRFSSIESDQSKAKDPNIKGTVKSSRNELLTVKDARPRSLTPNRQKKNHLNITSSTGSDISQASSMESVIGSPESIESRLKNSNPKSTKTSSKSIAQQQHNSILKSDKNDISIDSKKDRTRRSGIMVNSKSNLNVPPKDQDEAYISLEEGPKENAVSQTKKLDDDSVKIDKTFSGSASDCLSTPSKTDNDLGGKTEQTNGALENSDETESKECNQLNQEQNSVNETQHQFIKDSSLLETKNSRSEEVESKEENNPESTISTSCHQESDLSEENQENMDQFNANIDSKVFEYKSRVRSNSIQHKPDKNQFQFLPLIRNRSHSVHQASHDKSRPWGDVCTGSIAKALQNFSADYEKSISESSSKRYIASPPFSPTLDSARS